MNDLQAPARFLTWAAGIALTFGVVVSLGKLTYEMAKAAIEAQQHDQISYGKFSRQLWATPSKK